MALLAMVGWLEAMPLRRHRDQGLDRVQRRGPAGQTAGQLRGVDGDGGCPDVPTCRAMTVAAVVWTCCEAATAVQAGVDGWCCGREVRRPGRARRRVSWDQQAGRRASCAVALLAAVGRLAAMRRRRRVLSRVQRRKSGAGQAGRQPTAMWLRSRRLAGLQQAAEAAQDLGPAASAAAVAGDCRCGARNVPFLDRGTKAARG